MRSEQYAAEGGQPVATGTVVQQEPVVLSGTIVGWSPRRRHTVQPGKVPSWRGRPPRHGRPAARRHGLGRRPASGAGPGRPPARRRACGCCDPRAAAALLPTRCPCVTVGQLWHRIVEGGGGTVWDPRGVTIAAYMSGLWTRGRSTRLDFPSPLGLRLPPLHAQDPAGGREGGGLQDHPCSAGTTPAGRGATRPTGACPASHVLS